jgi:hypothetical protein
MLLIFKFIWLALFYQIQATDYQVLIEQEPLSNIVHRIGMNLSYWTTYGAGQYMKNVLKNPGFEGNIDRITVTVSKVSKDSFSDGKDLGMKDGHYDGAMFEVRSGNAAGTQGRIKRSVKAGDDGLPQYYPEQMPCLAINDVITITKFFDPDPQQMHWWVSANSIPLIGVQKGDVHPNSTGEWTAVLAPLKNTSAELNYYLDDAGEAAKTKFLPVEGTWRLSFWIKGSGASLQASFRRIGTTPFLTKTIQPSSQWQQISWDFDPDDNGSSGTLQLSFIAQAITEGAKILIDDVFLGPLQKSNPESTWRQETVEMIKSFKPSWLRDWQSQLGDAFENRIADPFKRKTYRFRLYGGEGDITFSYSIPDFLQLCDQVQANPWMIIPPTFSDKELTQFGEFLKNHAGKSRFQEIILEFGNENWNWIFRSEGIPIPKSHGPVADRAFHLIAAAAGPEVHMRRVINGQFANPSITSQFAADAKNYDAMAVAPYFFDKMDRGGTQESYMKELFADHTKFYDEIAQAMQKMNKKLMVYETNLHTINGTAPAADREPYVAGAASGTALAKTLIEGCYRQADPQIVFCLAQYDTRLSEAEGSTKLWGVVRDIGSTKRIRPTGLAVQMLNEVLGGSLHKMNSSNDKLTMAAFRKHGKCSAAIASADPESVMLEIIFPDDGNAMPTVAKVLEAASPTETNEEENKVKIQQKGIRIEGRKLFLSLPPYGFATLLPGNL